MSTDIDAGEGDQACRDQERKSGASRGVEQKGRRNGERRRRMVGGERKVGTSFDQQVSYPAVIRPNAMNDEKNELVEPQPQ